MQKSAAIPLPPRATASFLYKYSGLPTAEYVERLRVIIQEHEIYLPTLPQLNDPADGRPRLTALSEDEMSSFLYTMFVRNNPQLSQAELENHTRIIFYNVKRHGTRTLLRDMTEILHRELEGYRVYSMSMRYNNLSLWAKYAGDHSGYCLEFANEGPVFEAARDVLYEDSLRMDVNNPDHRNGFWFFCKRPEWSNEEEVRIVLPRKSGSKVKLDADWLRRLILGGNISKENEESIRSWARQRVPSLAVVKARYDGVEQALVLGP
jgi:hypothetical protein